VPSSQLTLVEIRRIYVEGKRPLPAHLERMLREDTRAGAQAILATIARRRRSNRAEGQRLRKMLNYERLLWSGGKRTVAGIDECGMSPLAGPVVAGAVILPIDFRWPGIDDSKKVDPDTREKLAEVIKRHAIAWAVGVAEVEEIDRINIYHAGLLAMRRALESLAHTPEALLVDARRVPETLIPQQSIVRGDELSLSIASASIVAKTTRDRHMRELDQHYPGYGFAKHKGYGVREHHEAIQRLGVLPIHRRSFGPVRDALNASQIHVSRKPSNAAQV